MKKAILGASLGLCGIIGLSAWIIANMMILPSGGVSSVISGLRSTNGIPVAAAFLLVGILGIVVSVAAVFDRTNK